MSQPKKFSAVDMSLNQTLGGITLDYVLRMGGDAGLIALAEATPPWEVHFLTPSESRRFRVDNTGSTDTGWQIEAHNGGAILKATTIYSNRPPVTIAMFCRQRETGAMVTVSSSTSHLDRELTEVYGWQVLPTLQQITQSLSGLEISGQGWKQNLGVSAVSSVQLDGEGSVTVVIRLPSASLHLIRTAGLMRVDLEFPLSFSGFLYNEVASKLPSGAVDLILRNCIR